MARTRKARPWIAVVLLAGAVALGVWLLSDDTDEPDRLTDETVGQDAPVIDVAAYLPLQVGSTRHFAGADKPDRRREVTFLVGPERQGVAGPIHAMRVGQPDRSVELLLAYEDGALWLHGFIVNGDTVSTDQAWLEPPVRLGDGRTSLDGRVSATDIQATCSLRFKLGPLERTSVASMIGEVSVRWSPADPVLANQDRFDDVATLALLLDVVATAEVGGLPIEKGLTSRVEGVLARDVGWVELRSSRRRYVLSEAASDG